MRKPVGKYNVYNKITRSAGPAIDPRGAVGTGVQRCRRRRAPARASRRGARSWAGSSSRHHAGTRAARVRLIRIKNRAKTRLAVGDPPPAIDGDRLLEEPK